MNKQIFYGQYKRIASYFEGTDLAATGLPTGRELELLETVRDKVPPEVFKKPYTNPVNGNPTRYATICAKRCGCCTRPATRCATSNWSTPRPASLHEIEFLAEDPSFERVFLFYKPSLDRLGMSVTVRTVDEAQFENRAAQLGFRHHHHGVGGIAVAGQRAARLLGLAGGRSARLAQHRRHQKSGGRRHDRAGDLRQEPRRSRGRHPRARPHPAVEPLRRAAMDLRQGAHRALGPLRPSRSDAEIRQGGIPDGVVVGRRKSGEDAG